MKFSIRVFSTVFAAFAFLALIGTEAGAQHLISSKAGLINNADGEAYISPQEKGDGERTRATLGTQMQDGDKLSVEAGGKAELLLNPGSFLRANENTEIHAVDTSLNQVRFEVTKGSVIIEAGAIDKELPLEIITPQGTLLVAKKGLYRIDVKGDMTSATVRQGELYFGTRRQVAAKQAFKIGHDKIAQLTGNSVPALAKLSKDALDEFDAWSESRAETIVAANNNTLIRSRKKGTLAYGWMYDPFFSTYTYIPRKRLFFSPYGFGFSNNYYRCNGCYFGFYNFGVYNFPNYGSQGHGGNHKGHQGPRASGGSRH